MRPVRMPTTNVRHYHRILFAILILCVAFTDVGKAEDSASSSSSDSAVSSSSASAASSSSDSAVSSSSASAASSSSDSAASSSSDSAVSSSSGSAPASSSASAASSSSDSAASSSSASAASSSSDSAASSSSDSAASSSSDSAASSSSDSYDDSSDDDYDDYDEFYFDDSYYDMITTLDDPAPNVPLMFSTPYLNYFGSRTLLSEQQLPGIAVAINSTTSVSARVQLWASSETSVVKLQGQTCTSYMDYTNNTVSTLQHYGCDDMVMCNEVTGISVGGASSVSSFFISALLVATPSTSSASSSSDGTCTSGVLSTVLTTSAPILSKPQSAYVVLTYNMSMLSNESAAAASAIASSPAFWNGSGTVHLTRSPQVVTMEKSITSKPKARLYAFQPDSATRDAEVGTITLSNTTALTSECIVHDVSSYTMTRITESSFTRYEHEYVADDPLYDGVSTLQAYCNTDEACLGFTTFIYRDFDGSVEEHPLAILRAGSSDSAFEYPRMVYIKRTQIESTCSVVTRNSGTIAVWIEQTSSDDATVDVYVNGFYARTCGTRESPFASGVSGKSSDCGTYNLCYTGQTYPGAVVKVVPHRTYATASSQSACVGALHVLFQQTSVDSSAIVDTRPVYTPPASLANFASTFPSSRLIELKYNVETVITVYVRNINRAALQLKQTGYDCNSTNDCPESLVEFWLDSDGIYDDIDDTVTDQSCGGLRRFNGYDGLSNNCQTNYFCGEAVGAGEDTVFTGWIYIVPQISFLFAHSTLCKYFSGTLSMSKKDTHGNTVGNDRTLSYAPLLTTDSTFRVLIAADSSMEVEEVVSEYFNVTNAAEVVLLPLENLYLEDYALYATSLAKLRSYNLRPTMVQACVMDWISADSATCTFMVPAGSNFLALRVEQSTFAETKNYITTTFTARNQETGKAFVAATTYCGGSYGFSGELAVDGECDTYLDCTRQFLYKSDALMRTEPIESITISVPRTVSAGQPCYASAAIIAEFEYDATEVPSDCEFLCSYSRECIPYSWVCDGVSDCPDAADEQGCNLFQIAEKDRHFNSTAVTVFTATNFLGCIRRSLGIGSNYFAYQASLLKCTVYAAANGTAMGLNPLNYLINVSGVDLYRYATAPYKHCTSLNTCSGNGVLMVAGNGACSCFCNNGYSGSSCSDLVTINSYAGIQVLFSSTLSATISAIQADAASALKYLTDSTISITCASAFPLDAATIAVLCTGTMTGLSSVLTSPSALELFNAQLKPEIDQAVGIGFYTVPGFNKLSTCVPGGATNNCPLPTATKLKGAVVAWNQPPAAAASLTLGVTSNTASRRLGSSTQTFSCGGTSSVAVSSQDGGCSTFSCHVPLGVSAVTSISATAAAPATAECTPSVASVSFATGFTLSTVPQPLSISNVNRDFTPFLAGGIVLLCFAVLLLCVAFGLFCIDKSAVDELTREIRYSSLSSLHKLLRITFVRMGYYQDEAQFVRKERWSVALLVVALNFIIAGVFLILFFLTGAGFSSDTSLGVEIYTSSACETSSTSSSPLGAFVIDGDESKTCAPRQVAGTAAASYASGYCELIGGVAIAFVRVAKSKDVCKTLPYVRVTSGSCVAISTVIPSITAAQYVRVECGRKSSIQARFTDIQAIAVSSTQTDSIDTEMLEADFYQYWRDASLISTVGGTTTYSFVGVRSSGLMTTTSSLPVCLESHAPGSTDYDTASKARVLVQVPSEAFQAPRSTNYYSATADIETTNYKVTDQIVATGLGPKDGDLPLGRIYNRFNTTTYNAGTAAAAASTHYYDVQYSRIDVGAWYGENTKAKDGDGFTISMYLKATRNALGFAFAVTDAYEDIASRSSPALDKAIDMLTRNSPPDVWFSSTYHIYSSLYVNGPASSLHFIHANPSTTADGNKSSSDARSERFVDVKWNIEELGLEHLFNGLWHHVAIILRSENSQTKAQLVVDGETSLSKAGWNQCMSRRPTQVFNITAGLSVPAYSASRERLMSGGMLYTGYFNGGIGHLRFRSEAVPTYTLWLETTSAIRQKNAIATLKFTILGWGLISLGLVFFLIMAVSSGRSLWKDRKRGNAQLKYATKTLYNSVIDRRTFSHEPISVGKALEWLGLTKEQLIIFLQELEASSGNPAQEVFRVLYMVRRAALDDAPVNQSTSMPTPDEWKALLRDDADNDEKPTGLMSVLSFRRKSGAVSDAHDPPPPRSAEDRNRIHAVGFAPQLLALGNNNLVNNDIELASVSTADDNVDVAALAEENKRKGGAQVDIGGAGNTKIASGGGESKMLSGNNAAALSLNSAVPPALKELASPVIMAVQSVYVWISSIPFPRVYETYFQGLFSFISVDWAVAFTIPTIITPLIQFFGGMLVFAFLAYHAKMDEYRFAWYLARYTLKRDALLRKAEDKSNMAIDPEKPTAVDAAADPLSYVGDLMAAIPYPFGNFKQTPYEYSISVLPVEACQAIDRFVGISKMPEKNTAEDGGGEDGGDVQRLQEQEELAICSSEGQPFLLRKPPMTKLSKEKLVSALTVESDEHTFSIEPIGVCCREHPKRLLVPQTQTDIWPFVFPPSCCVAFNGKRCGCSIGTIFVCGEQEQHEDGSVSMCDFAICERHIRHEPKDLIMSMVLQLPRQVEQQGTSWLLATVFILLANAAYTPFMQTALMILACSPFYQCEFEKCWGSTMDQKFSLAVYLCLVIVVLLGVGLPLLQTLQLRRCRKMMELAFFADEYDGAYVERDGNDDGGDNNEVTAVSEERPLHHHEVPVTPSTPATAAPTQRRLKLDEWIRFTSSDPTVMGTLYKTLTFEWMFMSPIILAWKIIIIIPAVFLPADTFEQRVGIAAAQLGFSLFIFLTSPFISPMIDLMYRLGCVHQLIFLGVASLSFVSNYDGGSGYSIALVAVTMAYLAFCGVMIVASNIVPVLRTILDTNETKKVLTKLGLQYSMTTSIYIVPGLSNIKREDRTPQADTFTL